MEFRRLQNKPHSYFIGGEGATAAAAVEGVSTPMDTLFMVARDEIASFKKKQEAENAAKVGYTVN